MSKKSRNIRARKIDSESEDEQQNQNPNISNATSVNSSDTTSKQNTNKQDSTSSRKPISSSKLSFDIDEGGDFQLKKSNHSKKIAKQLKEKAREEAKVSRPNVLPEKSLATSTHVYRLEEEEEDNDEEEKATDLFKKRTETSMHDILKSGEIPDANMIHLARKKRQMARECGGGEDFIPLDDTQRFEKNNSRLIRDDDNDASDSGDETNVLALTTKQKDAQRRWMEEKILAAAEDSPSDNELDKWEEQQIRKGTSIPTQQVIVTATNDHHAGGGYPQFVIDNSIGMSLMNYTIPNNSSNNLSALQAAELKAISRCKASRQQKTMKERLEDFAESLKGRTAQHSHLLRCTGEAASSIESLTEGISVLKEDYKFYQEMRGFARDYVDCMNEKMSSIAYLDRCMMELMKQRADKLVNRRQEDVRDQSLEFFPGKLTSEAGNEDTAKVRRKAEREGRRTRRKRARENKETKDHREGMSTDDELTNSEVVKFNTEKERLVKDCKTALDDVDEEFCSVFGILSRFNKWKAEKLDSYTEAYVGHCLTNLFSPLIKLQLITWNPLETYCLNFEKSKWFQELLFYGSLDSPEGGDGKDLEFGDADAKLLPNIIDKVLVPRIIALIESVWDPLSLQQSIALRKVVHQLASDYPLFVSGEKNAQALVKAIDQRIIKCLKDDIFMPLYGKNVLENRSSAATAFFYRQLYACVKLFKSILLWRGIISDRELQSLALNQLLNKYIMIALQNAPFGAEVLSICQLISSAVPQQWFEEYIEGITLPQFDNLCRFLTNSATNLKNQVPFNSETRDTMKQISKVLLQLNAQSYATTVANLIGTKI